MTKWLIKQVAKEQWWSAPLEERRRVRPFLIETVQAGIESGFIKECGMSVDNREGYYLVEGTETEVAAWIRKFPLQYIVYEAIPLVSMDFQIDIMKKGLASPPTYEVANK